MNIESARIQTGLSAFPAKEMTIGFDQKYLVCALVYAAGGMSLGLFMAASHNHGQLVTHAHALLVGFVASLLYAIIHKLWLADIESRLAHAQFFVHQAGAAAMVIGLYELYGASAPKQVLEPLLAVAAIAVLTGALLMLLLIVRCSIQSVRSHSTSPM